MKQETKNDIALAITYALMVIVVAGIVCAVFVVALREIVKIAAPIIAAASGIMIAILNHAMATLRVKEEEHRRLKQQNYIEIVGKLAPYIRTRRADQDMFETAHMQTWVVGSPDVVKATIALMGKGGNEKIKQLLLEMRRDIGLEIADLGHAEVTFLEPTGSPGSLDRGG